MAAKAGMALGGLVLLVLLVGLFGGDGSVHHLGDALYTIVHWAGHWVGKIGHWVGQTWQSYFKDHPQKSAA